MGAYSTESRGRCRDASRLKSGEVIKSSSSQSLGEHAPIVHASLLRVPRVEVLSVHEISLGFHDDQPSLCHVPFFFAFRMGFDDKDHGLRWCMVPSAVLRWLRQS